METKDAKRTYPISQKNTNRLSKPSPAGNLQRNVISRNRTQEIDEEAEAELLFLTDISRPSTTVQPVRSEENEDSLQPVAKEPLSPPDVRAEIYRRECFRLSVVPVSSYLKSPTRNSLSIRNSTIGPRGAMALSAPLMLDCNITHLDLTGNSIRFSGLECLLDSFHESMSVTHLNLSENALGTEGVRILCQAMLTKKCVFESLKLSGNGLKDGDSMYIAEIIEKVKSLKELIISHNEFGDQGGYLLGDALGNNDSLDTLDISWNHIRRRSAAAFMKGIKTNMGLKTLDIRFNGLGSEGARGLAAALKKNRSLTEIDLSHNRLLDNDAILIGKSLTDNDTLKRLKIGDNLITPEGAYLLLRSLDAQDSVSTLEDLDLKEKTKHSQVLGVELFHELHTAKGISEILMRKKETLTTIVTTLIKEYHLGALTDPSKLEMACVDQRFMYLLHEVKEGRDLNVTYGRVLLSGKPIPRRRRKRRKKKIEEKQVSSETLELQTDLKK